jgi:hypothetical protein
MIPPHANVEAMNLHLSEISTQVAPRARAVPELNPTENVWDYLRQNKLCATVWDTHDDIVEPAKTPGTS